MMQAQTKLKVEHVSYVDVARGADAILARFAALKAGGVKIAIVDAISNEDLLQLGRALEWVDFNFYGHQIVAHLSPGEAGHRNTSAVDGDNVPVRHFGAILSMSQWQALADKLVAAGTKFVVEPHVRFKGKVGKQATMFFLDTCGNALEFKAFGDISQVFAK